MDLVEDCILAYERDLERQHNNKRPIAETNLFDIKYYRYIYSQLGFEFTLEEIISVVEREKHKVSLGKILNN